MEPVDSWSGWWDDRWNYLVWERVVHTMYRPLPPTPVVSRRGVYDPPPVSDGVTPTLALDLIVFPPILPAPVRDYRMFDFSADINNPSAQISEAQWYISVMPGSVVNDPNPEDRLHLAEPVVDQTAQTTSQLFADGVDGVTYLLVAQVSLDDGRLLVKRGSLTCLAESLMHPPLARGAVAFDYHKFITLFPEFKEVSPQQAHAFWSMACEIVRNDYTSPVQDPREREEILLLLTAHICALFGGPLGGGGFGPQITSTINSKSVDGVSLSGGGMFGGVNGTQAWYQLTRYGQLAWMKLRAYRLFHYVPGGQRTMTNPFTSWPWIQGWHPSAISTPGWGMGGGRWACRPIVIIPPPGPPGPPGPTGPQGDTGESGPLADVVTDEVSIEGTGQPDNPLRVARVSGGRIDGDGATGGATGGSAGMIGHNSRRR